MVEEEMKNEGDGDGEVGDMEDGDIRRWENGRRLGRQGDKTEDNSPIAKPETTSDGILFN
jgi:hypothetical protein